MAVSTRITLDGPAPVAPRFTLLGAADSTPPPDGHWILGGELAPYPGSPARGWELCDNQDTKETSDYPDPDPFDGFTVYLAVQCTTRGLDIAALRQKAQAAFQVYEHAVVEDQFWNGTIVSTNPHLTDANAVDLAAGGVDVVTGFALLEAELAANQQSGMIHLSPYLATYALAAQLVERDGGVLRTKLGTVVVPGMGYDGSEPEAASAPSAGTEYAYATNGVRVMRSPAPVTIPAGDAEALDRGNNDYVIYVEREYLVAWDGAVQAAVLIDPTLAL